MIYEIILFGRWFSRTSFEQAAASLILQFAMTNLQFAIVFSPGGFFGIGLC
jgi:hypothetical protein